MRENCTYGSMRGRTYPAGASRPTLHNMCDMSEKLTVGRKSVFVLKAINPVGHPESEGKYDQDLETGDIEAESVQ